MVASPNMGEEDQKAVTYYKVMSVNIHMEKHWTSYGYSVRSYSAYGDCQAYIWEYIVILFNV